MLGVPSLWVTPSCAFQALVTMAGVYTCQNCLVGSRVMLEEDGAGYSCRREWPRSGLWGV